MNYTEHKITLDVHKPVSTTSICVKKGDNAHRLLINLAEGGYPYHIAEGCTAAFSAVKSDGKVIFNECAIDGDVIIYDMTDQTTSATGIVNCEIQIYGAGGDLLTSATFYIIVDDRASTGSGVVSSDEFTLLTAMIHSAGSATTGAYIAANRADMAAAACGVIGSASGDTIHLDDAIDSKFVGMRIFGKTTQNGTPTPANPATLVSVGASGSIDLTSNDQDITIPISGGLRGIPVASGGNYTDANGQQWICDEIDFGRAVRVQRIGKKVFTGAKDENWIKYPSANENSIIFYISVSDAAVGMYTSACSHFKSVDKSWLDEYISMPGVYSDHDTMGRKYFRPPNESVVTLDELKMWLAENPTTLLYVLATPIETDLPDEVVDAFSDELRSYSGDTVVFNDAGAHMSLEYIMDARKYIDKMISTGIHEATLE